MKEINKVIITNNCSFGDIKKAVNQKKPKPTY